MSRKTRAAAPAEGVHLKTRVQARSPNQSAYLESMQRNTFTFGVGRAGTGKCHAKGTLIRMYDGSTKAVEDIQDGEYVMGDDSTPRLVYGTTNGEEEMYEITPNKGKPWRVNASHVLVLIDSVTKQVVEIAVREYLNKSDHWRATKKLYRVPVRYDRMPVKIDPYFMGLWLGDGNATSPTITNVDEKVIQYLWSYAKQIGMTIASHFPKQRCQYHRICETTPINKGGRIGMVNFLKEDFKSYGLMLGQEKFIPREYMINDYPSRLALLAGLVDSDGSLSCGGFEITQKRKQLALDIQELALSLGFWASLNERQIDGTLYYRVFISGETDTIPTIVPHKRAPKRRQKKNVRHFGFGIKSIGAGAYYGFAVDGNHKYLLDDFTVTHNTFLATWQAMLDLLSSDNKIRRIVVVRPVIGNKFGESIGALPGNIVEKMIPYGSSVLDNLLAFIDREHINKMIEDNVLEFIPLTLLRGRNLNNAFVIVEEAQNIKKSSKGVYMVMSRLGAHSKMVFNGDLAQSDLADDSDSALLDAVQILQTPPLVKGVGVVELYDRQDVQRHPLLYDVMEKFGELDDDPF